MGVPRGVGFAVCRRRGDLHKKDREVDIGHCSEIQKLNSHLYSKIQLSSMFCADVKIGHSVFHQSKGPAD